jgi:hypothetical protein
MSVNNNDFPLLPSEHFCMAVMTFMITSAFGMVARNCLIALVLERSCL